VGWNDENYKVGRSGRQFKRRGLSRPRADFLPAAGRPVSRVVRTVPKSFWTP